MVAKAARLDRAVFLVTMLFGLLASCAGGAWAQTSIGGATLVERDVRGTVNGRTARVAVGDPVYQDQMIATAGDAAARLNFLDMTNLAIGPASTVKLDRFIYSGGRGVLFDAGRGAFRFVSAPSGVRRYEVRTPQAIVGVRGTSFSLRVERARTTIVLNEGAVIVCLRARPRVCNELTQPRTYVTATARTIEGPFALTQTAWTFNQTCDEAGSAALCGLGQDQTMTPVRTNDGNARIGGSRSSNRDPSGGRSLGGGRGDNRNNR